jgi:hypothetical protein
MLHHGSIRTDSSAVRGTHHVSRRRLVLVSAAILVAAHSTAAADRFKMATGEEVIIGLVDPGTVTCIGGEAAAPPMLCTPGTKRIHLRNMVETASYIALAGEAAPLIDGTNTIVVNCNLDASLQGHCWGTFGLAVPAQGGAWEGAWSGQFDLANRLSSYTATGHGSGGTLEGLQIKVDAVNAGGNPSIVARILVPGR